MARFALVLASALSLAVPSAEARSAKGEGPTTIAVGYGAVWIGMGDGTVRRIDAHTQRAGAPIHVAGSSRMPGFVYGLVAAHGAVWAATGDALVRIDPRTLRVEEVRVGRRWRPYGVAAGARSLWVRDLRDVIFEVDPRRRAVVRVVGVRGRLVTLAAGAAGAWALVYPHRGSFSGPAGPRVLRRIDARPRVVRRFACDQALTVGSSAVWTADQCAGGVRRFDAHTDRERGPRHVAKIDPLATMAPNVQPAVNGGAVWVTGPESLIRLDVRTLRVVTRLRIARCCIALAAGDRAVWLLNGDGRVVRVDVRNRVVRAPISPRRS